MIWFVHIQKTLNIIGLCFWKGKPIAKVWTHRDLLPVVILGIISTANGNVPDQKSLFKAKGEFRSHIALIGSRYFDFLTKLWDLHHYQLEFIKYFKVKTIHPPFSSFICLEYCVLLKMPNVFLKPRIIGLFVKLPMFLKYKGKESNELECTTSWILYNCRR